MSLRTLYRDIATLVGQGVPVRGEAGVGYVMEPGFFLPPLMFDTDELDALALGLRLVIQRGDPGLAAAAGNALGKIVAVLPPGRADETDRSGLIAAPRRASGHLGTIRRAMRAERTLRLRYSDKHGAASDRLVWPVALGFFEATEVLSAWCELRRDFRHFRLDRIEAAEMTDAPFPRPRRTLLAEWRRQQDFEWP